MNTYLSDRQQLIILQVRDGKVLQQIADTLKVSLRSVQKEMDYLIDLELVERIKNENGKTKMNGRQLTKKGTEWLKQNGYKV